MDASHLTEKDLKKYPHFDLPLSLKEINRIVTTPTCVASNAFFPFIHYEKRWQPFRTDETRHKAKVRPIRYASRRDAYIFAHYREILAVEYEALLSALGIENCPIAYRKIPTGDGTSRGKCNIHFAKDAFNTVAELGNCVAIALDIKSYFDSLDHGIIESVWKRLLKTDSLGRDHAQVLKAITKYSFVNRDEVYERLGYMGEKDFGGQLRPGYLIPFHRMPKQLCSPKVFREKIAGGDPSLPSIIHTNDNHYGIPQGAPISDLIANFYLLDFDVAISSAVKKLGGRYFRYSDDILIIVPGGHNEAASLNALVEAEIKKFGDQLEIKKSKTAVVAFEIKDSIQCYRPILGDQAKNGLDYLGFRFDGRKVYVRDKTISGFHRKIVRCARHAAWKHVARYPGKNIDYLTDSFDYAAFIQRFGRVKDFEKNIEYRKWTFWTYLVKASEVFGPSGNPILRQVKGYKERIRKLINSEIVKALVRRSIDLSKGSTSSFVDLD